MRLRPIHRVKLEWGGLWMARKHSIYHSLMSFRVATIHIPFVTTWFQTKCHLDDTMSVQVRPQQLSTPDTLAQLRETQRARRGTRPCTYGVSLFLSGSNRPRPCTYGVSLFLFGSNRPDIVYKDSGEDSCARGGTTHVPMHDSNGVGVHARVCACVSVWVCAGRD